MSQQLLTAFNLLKEEKDSLDNTPQSLLEAFKTMMDELDKASPDRLSFAEKLNIEGKEIPSKTYFMDHVLTLYLFGKNLFQHHINEIDSIKQNIIDSCINAVASYNGPLDQVGRNGESFIFWMRLYVDLYGFAALPELLSAIETSNAIDVRIRAQLIEAIKQNRYLETVIFPDKLAADACTETKLEQLPAAVREKIPAPAARTNIDAEGYVLYFPYIINQQLRSSEKDMSNKILSQYTDEEAHNVLAQKVEPFAADQVDTLHQDLVIPEVPEVVVSEVPEDTHGCCSAICETLSCIAQTLNPCNAITALGSLASCIGNAVFCQAPTQVFNFFSSLCGSDENVEDTHGDREEFELLEVTSDDDAYQQDQVTSYYF